MEKTVAQILNEAADLIAKPGGWTQGAFSRDAHGIADMGDERWAEEPVCFCIRGACLQVTGGINDGRLADSIILKADRLLEQAIGEPPVWFNDRPTTTQAKAVAALRKAAELATPSRSESL